MTGGSLLKQTYAEFSKDKCFRLSAAVAYYAVFSLAPMLVIVIAAAGLFWGQEAASGALFGQIKGMVGEESAAAIQGMTQSAYKPGTGVWAAVIGVAALLITSTTLFVQLQDALNEVFDVEPPQESGIWYFVRTRLLSFGLVLTVAFLLLVTLVVNAALAAFFNMFSGMLGEGWAVAAHAIEFGVSTLIVSLLFALIFKYLPDARLAWRDVWIGSLVTGVLFAIGRTAIGLYLGRSDLGAAYGSAAALVVILLWVNYAALILFVGAEFTQVWANRRGAGVRPVAGEPQAPRPQGRPTAH